MCIRDRLSLIQELADFENEPDAVTIDEQVLQDYGTGAQPLFTCFVAEAATTIVGIALVYYRFSTWKGRSLHLEDLIVTQEYRGKGVGSALYRTVMRYAKNKQVRRVSWEVLNWNTHAIDFYERTGARILKDWQVVHFDEDKLENYLNQSTKK